MAPQNLFGVLTVLSFLWALPCALIIEGPTALATWTAATALQLAGHILRYTVSIGLFPYLYNEVAKLALSKVNPLMHAVANTLKRVVILLACVIAGSYLYSTAKGREKSLAKATAKATAKAQATERAARRRSRQAKPPRRPRPPERAARLAGQGNFLAGGSARGRTTGANVYNFLSQRLCTRQSSADHTRTFSFSSHTKAQPK